MLDTIGHYPHVWAGPAADAEDQRSVVEFVACLIAYNVAADGTATPVSCSRGFAGLSFGTKTQP